ncbi:MAG: quinol:electron acceptor oxidoreductase subunit ActD [Acidobacteriota bacterium]
MSEAEQDRFEVVGAIAIYGAPDELAEGVLKAREAGFTRLDTVSPYPLHGMDHVLGKGPSRLGYIAAAAGLTATVAAKTAQWWVSAIDYPLNIGGNPLFALPAFVPVTFELMVVFASLTTVISMLGVFNGLPRYGSALLRSSFIRDLTCNRYALVVDAADRRFGADTILKDLSGPNVQAVELLKREKPSLYYKERILSVPFLVLVLGVVVFSSTATRLAFRYGGELPLFNFMKHQTRLSAQTPSSVAIAQPMRGTVARGFLPYAYQGRPEEAGADLVNTLPVTGANLARGRDRFTVFCQPCHGRLADGRGTLTPAFPKAPTLHSRKVREWTDGRIYAVLTEGQNLMPKWEAQISRDDRWLIIHYLRVLQRSQHAPDQDLP